MVPVLVIPTDGKPRSLAVDGPTRIGRKEDCALRLESPNVSRHHAQVTWDGTRAWVKDLGSHNGTFVNGRRIHEATVLNDRDELRLADVTLGLRLLQHAPRGVDPQFGTGSERGLIIFHCPNCAHRLGAALAMANFVRTCPACGRGLIVSPPPEPGAKAAAAPAATPAPHADAAPIKDVAPAPVSTRNAAEGEAAHEAVEPLRVEPRETALAEAIEGPHDAAAPPPGYAEAAPHLQPPSVPITVLGLTTESGAPRSTPEPPPCRNTVDEDQPSDTEAPGSTAEPVRRELPAGEVASTPGVPAARETAGQDMDTAQAPNAPSKPRRLEPVQRIASPSVATSANGPTPRHEALTTTQSDELTATPLVTVVERSGIRMNHHPSAAPVHAERHPPAVNTVTELPHLNERDWFAAPINQPWRPASGGRKERRAKKPRRDAGV